MVLIDTSVWIRSLVGQEPFRGEVDRLLARKEAVGHVLVFGELLMGDRGGRKDFLDRYELLPHAGLLPHRDVVAFVRRHHLHGLGVGWIDVHLLASAAAGRFQLWTADSRFAATAADLGVAYAA